MAFDALLGYLQSLSQSQALNELNRDKDPSLSETLRLLNPMPKISFNSSINGGVNYRTLAAYSPLDNTLEFTPEGTMTPTVSHEFTHALDTQMAGDAKTWKTGKPTSAQQQFIDAYEKLNPERTRLPLDFKGSDEDLMYRMDPREMRAYGVGNFSTGGNSDGYKFPHLDATMASDMAVLRNLYTRAKAPPTLTDLLRHYLSQ